MACCYADCRRAGYVNVITLDWRRYSDGPCSNVRYLSHYKKSTGMFIYLLT